VSRKLACFSGLTKTSFDDTFGHAFPESQVGTFPEVVPTLPPARVLGESRASVLAALCRILMVNDVEHGLQHAVVTLAAKIHSCACWKSI